MTASLRTSVWVSVFAISFALVEAAVVVYLRGLYYPEGFAFPLKAFDTQFLTVEISREIATIVMLVAVGILAGTRRWERFGYFMIAFGVWDIFYYVWLKLWLDWPSSIVDWDVLFLIPLPWIGPVLAPVIIALLMTTCGILILLRIERGLYFHPSAMSWIAAVAATGIVLYSFVSDLPATLGSDMPLPYPWWQLGVGVILYLVSFRLSCVPGEQSV